jgi:nucleotide-binding universal stress UspA family protein
MKTILVPTDLSTLADGALQVAADLARTYNAEILLVHYIPFLIARANTVEGAMAMASYFDEKEDTAVVELQQQAANPIYKDLTIIPITCRDEGSVREAMTERHADLIVLATHGTSGWDEWLLGSNAEHIVRYAHCPVLVLKQAVVPFDPTNAIAAINVDDAFKQHWPMYPFDASHHGLKQFIYITTPSDCHGFSDVHQRMRELATEKSLGAYDLQIRPARNAETGILHYALERKADLIVLYTHSYTGLRHLVQGSVAENVLNQATVPVLILHLNSH